MSLWVVIARPTFPPVPIYSIVHYFTILTAPPRSLPNTAYIQQHGGLEALCHALFLHGDMENVE